jgi:hypothetical protein
MAADRWNEIEALFHEAQDCLPDGRAGLVAQAEPDVRGEVESLLAKHSRAGPLDGLAVDLLKSGDTSAALDEPVTRLEGGLSLGLRKSLHRRLDARPRRNGLAEETSNVVGRDRRSACLDSRTVPLASAI